MRLGKALLLIRRRKGLKQKDVAKAAGICQTALLHIESGESWPHLDTLNRICDALGVKLTYVLLHSLTDVQVREDRQRIFNHQLEILKMLLE